MSETYTIAMKVMFESTVEVEVEADSEDEAVDLAYEAVDIAEPLINPPPLTVPPLTVRYGVV